MPHSRNDAGTSRPSPSLAEIRRTLAVLFSTGDVVEIRAFKSRRSTISGYYDDFERLAEAAVRINRVSGGVYVTLNQINRELLARRTNRYEEHVDTTTSDAQVVRRRWFPIDLDPVRPAGISASNEEHELALFRARQIRKFLVDDRGWPDPIMADSGNGGHLLFHVDLPNDKDSTRLVQQGLQALAAQFSDEKVAVDESVHNAARIWKLHGTVAGKGDHTPTRPHRLSRLLEVPGELRVVSLEQLRALAAVAPADSQKPSGDGGRRTAPVGPKSRFDLDGWIIQHHVHVTGPTPWQNGRKWVFPTCPWNAEHADRSAYLVQAVDGTISAGCHHNGCAGNGWHELRDVVEPGWRSRRSANRSDVTSTSISTAPAPWQDPEPLGLPDRPEFPVDALPDPLRSWARAEAVATQTPVDLAAMLGLAVAAACVAKRVEVWVRNGWIEPLNLYTVVMLEPANRKSGVFSDATVPLREFERDELQRLAPQIREYRIQVKVLEGRQKRLEDQAAKTKDPEQRQALMEEATEVANELATLTPVAAPRLIIDDCTPERLASLLVEQGGRIACMSAEGGVFDVMKGAYSKNGIPLFSVYLQGHAGDDIRVDRVSRPSEYIHRPAITMALAVQPEVIRGMADQQVFRGRGLLARFLYSLPSSTLGQRQVNPPAVPYGVASQYAALMQTLCLLAPAHDSEGRPTPHHIEPSPEALELLHDYMRQIEPELGAGGRLAGLRDWGGKLAGAVVRIAGVLHMASHAGQSGEWTTNISARTVRSAIEIGRYLTAHAEAAFQLMQQSRGHSDAEHVLGWILRYGRREFSKRELHQATKNRFLRVEDMDVPLNDLMKHFIIRPKMMTEPPRSGRPGGPTYEVNPAVFRNDPFTSGNAEDHPQYPQYASEAQQPDGCGDIGDAFEVDVIAMGHGGAIDGVVENQNLQNHPQYPQNSWDVDEPYPARGSIGDIGDGSGNDEDIVDELNVLLDEAVEEDAVWMT